VGIPHPDDPRIPTDKKRPTLLFPVGHNPTSGATFHRNDIVQRSERANHLDRTIHEVGVVVAIQTNDPFGCRELSLAQACGRLTLTRRRQDHRSNFLVDNVQRGDTRPPRVTVVEKVQSPLASPVPDTGSIRSVLLYASGKERT
jgi:hypothetical protein